MSSVGSKGVIIQDALGGDAVTVTDGKLDVNADLTVEGDLQIGAVEIKDQNSGVRAEVNASGELLVTAPPATFNTITTNTVTTTSDVNWHTLPDLPGNEIQIQSASTNTSNILLSKDGAEIIGIELLPSTSIAFPISNTDLIEYKLSEAAVQTIYLTVLSNV